MFSFYVLSILKCIKITNVFLFYLNFTLIANANLLSVLDIKQKKTIFS